MPWGAWARLMLVPTGSVMASVWGGLVVVPLGILLAWTRLVSPWPQVEPVLAGYAVSLVASAWRGPLPVGLPLSWRGRTLAWAASLTLWALVLFGVTDLAWRAAMPSMVVALGQACHDGGTWSCAAASLMGGGWLAVEDGVVRWHGLEPRPIAWVWMVPSVWIASLPARETQGPLPWGKGVPLVAVWMAAAASTPEVPTVVWGVATVGTLLWALDVWSVPLAPSWERWGEARREPDVVGVQVALPGVRGGGAASRWRGPWWGLGRSLAILLLVALTSAAAFVMAVGAASWIFGSPPPTETLLVALFVMLADTLVVVTSLFLLVKEWILEGGGRRRMVAAAVHALPLSTPAVWVISAVVWLPSWLLWVVALAWGAATGFATSVSLVSAAVAVVLASAIGGRLSASQVLVLALLVVEVYALTLFGSASPVPLSLGFVTGCVLSLDLVRGGRP